MVGDGKGEKLQQTTGFRASGFKTAVGKLIEPTAIDRVEWVEWERSCSKQLKAHVGPPVSMVKRETKGTPPG